MNIRRFIISVLLLSGMVVVSSASLIPPSHPLFEEDTVHEFHLTFHQNGWWDSLTVNFEGVPDPIFMAAEFEWNGIHFDSIGVRFKGNSSYFSYPGLKKSFKLDIDEYVDGQEIHGLDKINLNNGFSDPTCVREKCCYELSEAMGLPTVRTNYVALYINGDYWGLYTLVEQVDKEFIESRFGTDEDGNLWKGDPHGTLRYLGPDESDYYQEFELENNEDDNDWSALVELADGLNNTPVQNLPDTLSDLMDVNSALAMIALDIFTVNLDSYIGRCCNYYFYHRDLDSRMVFFEWDLNEAWGLFNQWNLSVQQLRELDPFWSNPEEERPLAGQLWQIDEYRSVYLGHMKQLMTGAACPDTLVGRMESLRDMIRPYIYDDPNKMFTNEDFDAAMSSDVFIGFGPHNRLIPALDPFIRHRDSWLRGVIGEWERPEGLVLNELMADNETSIQDDFGDNDDWIELANAGNQALELTSMVLTDNVGDITSYYSIPASILEPGEYIIIWADGEPEEGELHSQFRLDADGEDLVLLHDAVIVDMVTFPDLDDDMSWGRWPDGGPVWTCFSEATPGQCNDCGMDADIPLASTFFLDDAYPNPFSDFTTVRFTIPDEYRVLLSAYDLTGRRIAVLTDGLFNAGTTTVSWNGMTDYGRKVPAGTYLLRMESGDFASTKRIVVLR